MARPRKNNADYFPHDYDMRNDKALKAIRRQFKSDGYAVYCMILETLTHEDNFRLVMNGNTLKLLAADFDLDLVLFTAILDELVVLDLIQRWNEVLSCRTLEKRFSILLSKRYHERKEGLSSQEPTEKEVIETKTTQSKVKNTKVKNSIENPLTQKDHYLRIKEFLEGLAEGQKMQMFYPFQTKYPRADLTFVDAMLKMYLRELVAKDDVYRENREYRAYFVNWFKSTLRNDKDKNEIDQLYKRMFSQERATKEVAYTPPGAVDADAYIKKVKKDE